MSQPTNRKRVKRPKIHIPLRPCIHSKYRFLKKDGLSLCHRCKNPEDITQRYMKIMVPGGLMRLDDVARVKVWVKW